MEVCLPSNKPTCLDISRNCGSLTDPSNSTHYSSGDLSMNDLKICLTEFLSVEDIEISTTGFGESPGKSNKVSVVREDHLEDLDNRKSSNSASEKCFSNCAAFPAVGEPKSSGLLSGKITQEDGKTSEASDVNGCPNYVDRRHSQSTLTPTPPRLVSALKGNREKQGIPPRKLSVTWAPDVYDPPIPTSVSHVPSSKNQHYRNNGKKYGKNKQKGGGKSSRGSKGKDKKQARKNNGGTTKSKPLHDDGVLVGFSEPPAENAGFNIVSADPFCGSSFLRKSVKYLHFPVTEAK